MSVRRIFPRIALVLLLLPAAATAQRPPIPQPPDDSDDAATAASLRALAEIEQSLLRQEMERYGKFVDLRRKLGDEIDRQYARLDEALGKLQGADLSASELSDAVAGASYLATEARRQEDVIASLVRDGGVIHERARAHALQLSQLKEKIARLEPVGPASRPSFPLTGIWRMKILPGSVSAVWTLRQTGTLVSGTYEMDGGRTGSLTGTLVDRKLALTEIDSKYGKDVTFYGNLSEDGASLRGTWEAFDLSGGRPGNGTWSGSRVPRPVPEAAPSGASGAAP